MVFLRKRRLVATFIIAWTAWFLRAAFFGEDGVIYDLYQRGKLAWESTADLVKAIALCIYSWTSFTAPFLVDVCHLLSRVNASLTWRLRIMTFAIISAGTGLLFIGRRVILYKENVIRVAFQSSILLVAPLLWLILIFMPNPDMWLPTTLTIATSVIPCILSARSFWRHDVDACGRWLRYWVVFPIVDACRDALQEYQAAILISAPSPSPYFGGGGVVGFDSQTSSSPSFLNSDSIGSSSSQPPSFDGSLSTSLLGTEPHASHSSRYGGPSHDAQRLLLILTLWLQIWDGSLSFHHMCTRMGSLVLEWLPVGITPRVWGHKWRRLRHINVLKKAGVLLTDHVALTCIMLLSGLAFAAFFFKFITKVVPLMIMWGASINAAEVVIMKIHQLYEQNLSFWVLMEATSLTLMRVPFLGTILMWFRIPILVCFYMFGQKLLNILGSALGLSSSSTSSLSSPPSATSSRMASPEHYSLESSTEQPNTLRSLTKLTPTRTKRALGDLAQARQSPSSLEDAKTVVMGSTAKAPQQSPSVNRSFLSAVFSRNNKSTAAKRHVSP